MGWVSAHEHVGGHELCPEMGLDDYRAPHDCVHGWDGTDLEL